MLTDYKNPDSIFTMNLIPVQTSADRLNILSGFHALSDPLRLQVVELLRSQELCVYELREQLEVSPSTLSFHLKQLKEANLLCSRQEGRWIYYSLNLSQFVILEEYLAVYRRFSPIIPVKEIPVTESED